MKTKIEDFISELAFTDDKYKDIIAVEHRSNNPKRDYLFVNKIQAKHIPCSPSLMKSMCKDLAHEVNKELNNRFHSILVVGFAETATGIARFVAEEVKNVAFFMCTTREDIQSEKELITFEEEHSHATTQKLFTRKDETFDFKGIDYILFVEDEISTGNTILNFIRAFKEQDVINSDIGFGVASVCNWQSEENKKKFRDNNVQTFALITGKLKDVDSKMNVSPKDIVSNIPKNTKNIPTIKEGYYLGFDLFKSSRLGDTMKNHIGTMGKYVDNSLRLIGNSVDAIDAKSIRVIGTEECMSPAIQIAYELELQGLKVRCHSTTRSKIDTIKNGCLVSRHSLISAYQTNRETYIYNLEEYTDIVVIVTDADCPTNFVKDILGELNTQKVIVINIK